MAEAQVVQCHRLRRDLLVVRLVGDVVDFEPGQSVAVTVPSSPHLPRRYSPALPPSRDGKYEFHIRAIPAGWVSGVIVNDTREGDIWTIDDPAGDLRVDDTDDDIVMVAGGTGLAPMRALLLDLARRPRPPRVNLYVGGRSPRDLYAADMLSLMARTADWLTVIPVVEKMTDPMYRDEYFDAAETRRLQTAPDTGFAAGDYLQGRIGEVVARRGPYLSQRVLVCGSSAMSAFTLRALTTTGTPVVNIRHG